MLQNCFVVNYMFVIFISFNFYQITHEECGRPLGVDFRHAESRVVNGYDIGYYRYPWYAALTRYNMVSCGGTLIGPKIVVSAAHCFKEFFDVVNKKLMTLEQVYVVKLGVYNICTTEKTARDYSVEKVFIHDLYYKNQPYYDISLIKLTTDTNNYTPICLPPPNLVRKPLDGSVPGLGTLRYHGAMPCSIHEARLLIYNDSACIQMIKNTGNDPNLIHNAFCAGYIQGGVDTCQGDSGGPLQGVTSRGNYVLLGIVSFGFKCAIPGLLGMYTDASKYIDWIQEKSGYPPGVLQFAPDRTSITGANINNSTNQGVPIHHHKHKRPHRRPIKLIIYRNKKLPVETNSLESNF